MSVICENAKTCGVSKTAVAGKNKGDVAVLSCEHASEHTLTSGCKNTTCLRSAPSQSKCVEIVVPVAEPVAA